MQQLGRRLPCNSRPAVHKAGSRVLLKPTAALSIPSTVRTTHQRTNLLEQAIPSLVHQLSNGMPACGSPLTPSSPRTDQSCLQLVRAVPGQGMGFEYKPLSSQDLTSEVWQQLMPAATLDDTLAVILARPIPDPLHYCPFSTPASPAPTTPTTSAASSSCDSSCSDGTCLSAVPDLQGSIDDDCCGGASAAAGVGHTHHHHHTPTATPTDSLDSTSSSGSAESATSETGRSRRRFLRRQARSRTSSHLPTPIHPPPLSPPAPSQPPASYYGLAVQTFKGSGPGASQHSDINTPKYLDGCYVLKLCRSSGVAGCTCTAYTLTHVCRGQPLYEQMQGSWLVN